MGKEFGYDQSRERAQSDFAYAVESLNSMKLRHIGILDTVANLKDIKAGADSVDRTLKEQARVVLKKILLVLPPWRAGTQYIQRELTTLAYTTAERAALTRLSKSAYAREMAIEHEIGNGASPWWARVRRNERSAVNPLVVGFYQDPEGKIRTLYGPRYFQSKRQMKGREIPFGGRTDDKEVSLLSTRFQKVGKPEIMKGRFYEVLPQDVRQRFESGEILVTGERDVYELDEMEIMSVAASNTINSLARHIETTIADMGTERHYYLLYYGDYQSDESGRTGVLTFLKDGQPKPFVVTIGDKEFVLEIKGCGKKGGGFGPKHYRTGRHIITGGAEREQAINEFKRLQDEEGEDGPKVVASILFDNAGYQQGYIVRLTPSTVRASYTSSEVYPDIESSDQVSRIVHIYAQELARHIFSDNPKILDRSSYTENILVWGDGRSRFVDHSDHVTFSDRQFPHEEEDGGYMTPRKMLEYYIAIVQTIPGYKPERDKAILFHAIEKVFFEHGFRVALQQTDEYDEVAGKLWESGVAYKVFSARRAGRYRADGAVQELRAAASYERNREELSLTSEKSFMRRYEKGFQEIHAAVDTLMRVATGDALVELERISGFIMTRNLSELLQCRDILYDILRDHRKFLTEGMAIYKAIGYFDILDGLFKPLRKYLEHEKDVLQCAALVALQEEKIYISEAKGVLEKKFKKLQGMMNHPEKFFLLLKDKKSLKQFITLSYYANKSRGMAAT